jgi:hypothetical protein
MTTKEDSKRRAIFLKKLREEHKETVAQAQALLKEQKRVRKEICQHIRLESKTVPDLAVLTGLPASDLLWHIMAMKKYGLVKETGMCGEYYLYQNTE